MSFLQDLRFALRSFRRAPAFTAIAVATLAIGIGANTAIFSVVDSVVLRPLPFPDAGQLVIVEQVRPELGPSALSAPDLADLSADNQVFTAVAGYHGDSVVLRGAGERPQQINGQATSADYFEVLGVAPALGRGFAPGEDTEGRNRVAIITWAAYQKYLGGDPSAIGRTVTLDDQPYTLIGVLGRDFRLVIDSDVEIFVPRPRSFDRELAQVRGGRFLQAIARLRPGVSVAQAQANLSAVAARLASAYPDTNSGRDFRATQLQTRLTQDLRPALLVLLAAVGFVLLIACANVANLLLARASVRHRELAIRIALGAGRGRLVRQLLTESVVLSLVGGALGVGLAIWGLDALRGLIPPEIARFQTVGVDLRVLAFSSGISLLVGVAFGLWPALSASRSSPGDALKDAGTRTTAHAGRQRARSVLVASEIALATLLLVGAALMLRSFQRVNQVDPGFRAGDLTTGVVAVPTSRYDSPEKLADFYQRFSERLDAIPGAQAAIGAPLPYSGMNMSRAFEVVGAPPLPVGQRNVAAMYLVGRDFFETMGIPVRAGRSFSAAEDRRGGPPVVVINEALARQYFPGQDPMGKRLALGRGEQRAEREVVGIVGDVRSASLEEKPGPAMYVPFPQQPWFVFG